MSQFITLNRIMKDGYCHNEAVKALRTNIQFYGSGIETIILTSPLSDERKSDITFAMTPPLAQIGKKVVMIDADIRKSVLVSHYRLGRGMSGLSQYLGGQRSLENVIYDTNIENFSMIFVGPYPPSPVKPLEENLFGDMISKLKEGYDYIIVDMPPMGNLIDEAIVARRCDGAMTVIESGSISYRLEQRVKG